MKKKIFALFLIFFLFLTVGRVLAYPPNQIGSLADDLKSPDWQLGSHTFTTTNKLIESLNALIIGTGDEEVDGSLQGTAVGGITKLITALYVNPPASSVEYFADLGKRLNIIQPAYAQGIGFEGLKPVLSLWKAFRNVAYLFFTIIFVVMGFAIMFRVKLNPQTVISIQNAIPRIIVALILVTFSYAIAGLLIDLIYILINLGVLVIAPAVGLDIAAEQLKYMSLSFSDGVGLLIGGGAQSIWTAAPALGAISVVAEIIGLLSTILSGNPLGTIIGSLPILILASTALWVIFKLFFSLLKCYLNIILSIIFAPLQIMLGVLPGAQMGFGSWFRNLLANIMVYPAVALFMLLGWILTNKSGPSWIPPVISVGGNALIAIIGFGMLLIVHKIPDMVKESFQVKTLPYGTAIGEALTPFKSGGIFGLQYTGQKISEKYTTYANKGEKVPGPVSFGNAVANTLKTLGIIK